MNIEKNSVLNKYLFSLIGLNVLRDLQKKLKDLQICIDGNWSSHLLNIQLVSFENFNSQGIINYELKDDWKPNIVYVNGQSVLTPNEYELRYIEPEFKRLMEV